MFKPFDNMREEATKLNNSKFRNRSRLPPSREAEYKFISGTLTQVNNKIKYFAQTYFSNSKLNYKAISEYLERIVQSWSINLEALRSYKDFLEILSKKDVDSSIRQQATCRDLQTICNRARDFENTIPHVREKLLDCARGHVYKYCQSLIEYAGDFDIKPVEEYEEMAIQSRERIDAKIQKMNACILRYGELKSSFHIFVARGEDHLEVMEDMCILIVEISHILKLWVAEDSVYPENLWQEACFSSSYKEKICDDIDKLYFERASHLKRIDRKGVVNKKLTRDYMKHKKEKDRLKDSVDTISNRISRLHEKLDETKEELRTVEAGASTKRSISPRQKEDSTVRHEQLKGIQVKLQEQLQVMSKQFERVQKNLKQESDRTYELKVEVVTNRHEREELQKEIVNMDLDIKAQQQRIQSIDRKSVITKQIRDMKLSPDTLRRIHQGKLESKGKGPEDSIDEACHIVAHNIGRHWKELYKNLPFDPPREISRIEHDVDVLDMISARRDRTTPEQAKMCLDKWRAFNRHRDVSQLVDTLRMVRMPSLAEQLENHFVVDKFY